MRRLTSEEKNKIKLLVKEGVSLNKISKVMHLSKTTVYYHFRRLKGMTIKRPRIHFDSKRELGEVIGLFAGDGSLHFEPKNYGYLIRVHFGIDNVGYLNHVKSLYEKNFGKIFNAKSDGKGNLIIETKSKDIFLFFHDFLNFKNQEKALTVSLKNKYENHNEFLIGFLKGLLDTDGTICSTADKQLRIVFYTSSKKLSEQISKYLRSFNISHDISEDRRGENISYHIYILKKSIDGIINLLRPFWAGRSTVETTPDSSLPRSLPLVTEKA